VLLADAFQDSEYFLPKFDIENTGAQTEVSSLDSKPIEIYSYFSRIGTLDVDKTISDADPGDYTGVLVPGGAKSPAILAESDDVRSFLRRVNRRRGLVASICRGSLLIARAGIAEGADRVGIRGPRQRHSGRRSGRILRKPAEALYGAGDCRADGAYRSRELQRQVEQAAAR
jgi:putative intracellular protease/amidase